MAEPPERHREAWAEIDAAALRHNAARLADLVAPAALCAVVKADGYGHGAVTVARAALAGGATNLGVALVEEGVTLREAAIGAPILLLSQPPLDAFEAAAASHLALTLDTLDGAARAGKAARAVDRPLGVHLKIDTGMHRAGIDPDGLLELARAVDDDPALSIAGVWTHLAVADGIDDQDRAYTAEQLGRFDRAVRALAADGVPTGILHTANSAGAIAWPGARYDMVRCGIALYGCQPSAGVAQDYAAQQAEPLRPALSLKARVAGVRTLDAGERPSYGRRRPLPERSVVATVPLGYADGVPRALFGAGYGVLVGGRWCPLAGMVTMDQLMVDCGPGAAVAPGDEVVLLGAQGAERISADDWARLLGTISYEVVSGIGGRVERRVVGEEPS